MADTATDGLEVVRLNPATWPMFDSMVVRHNGIFGGCWCTWFHPDSEDRGPGAEGSRTEKKMHVDCGVAHAALLVEGRRGGHLGGARHSTELPHIHHKQ